MIPVSGRGKRWAEGPEQLRCGGCLICPSCPKADSLLFPKATTPHPQGRMWWGSSLSQSCGGRMLLAHFGEPTDGRGKKRAALQG